MLIRAVRMSRRAQRDLRFAPPHVKRKLKTWIEGVNKDGLEAVRATKRKKKIKRYADGSVDAEQFIEELTGGSPYIRRNAESDTAGRGHEPDRFRKTARDLSATSV